MSWEKKNRIVADISVPPAPFFIHGFDVPLDAKDGDSSGLSARVHDPAHIPSVEVGFPRYVPTVGQIDYKEPPSSELDTVKKVSYPIPLKRLDYSPFADVCGDTLRKWNVILSKRGYVPYASHPSIPPLPTRGFMTLSNFLFSGSLVGITDFNATTLLYGVGSQLNCISVDEDMSPSFQLSANILSDGAVYEVRTSDESATSSVWVRSSYGIGLFRGSNEDKSWKKIWALSEKKLTVPLTGFDLCPSFENRITVIDESGKLIVLDSRKETTSYYRHIHFPTTEMSEHWWDVTYGQRTRRDIIYVANRAGIGRLDLREPKTTNVSWIYRPIPFLFGGYYVTHHKIIRDSYLHLILTDTCCEVWDFRRTCRTPIMSFPHMMRGFPSYCEVLDTVILLGGQVGCELTVGITQDSSLSSLSEQPVMLPSPKQTLKALKRKGVAVYPHVETRFNSSLTGLAISPVSCNNSENKELSIFMLLGTGDLYRQNLVLEKQVASEEFPKNAKVDIQLTDKESSRLKSGLPDVRQPDWLNEMSRSSYGIFKKQSIPFMVMKFESSSRFGERKLSLRDRTDVIMKNVIKQKIKEAKSTTELKATPEQGKSSFFAVGGCGICSIAKVLNRIGTSDEVCRIVQDFWLPKEDSAGCSWPGVYQKALNDHTLKKKKATYMGRIHRFSEKQTGKLVGLTEDVISFGIPGVPRLTRVDLENSLEVNSTPLCELCEKRYKESAAAAKCSSRDEDYPRVFKRTRLTAKETEKIRDVFKRGAQKLVVRGCKKTPEDTEGTDELTLSKVLSYRACFLRPKTPALVLDSDSE